MGTPTPAAPRTRVAEKKSITDEDRARARQQMPRAFALCGVDAGTCPICGNSAKGTVKLHQDGWKCFKDHRHPTGDHGKPLYYDAIALLREHGYTFVDAVNALLDRPVSDRRLAQRVRSAPVVTRTPDFLATVDTEVYAALMTSSHVSLEKAQAFYATWHIDPHAVAEAGARYVVNDSALHAELTEKFGIARLVAAGLIAPKDTTQPDEGGYFLVNRSYPVIEPHLTPTGAVVGLQFRASPVVARRVKSYASRKAAYEEQLARWVSQGHDATTFRHSAPRYEPKFLSLRGAGTDSLVGCGLWRVGRLRAPRQIYVVEGFKDLLAARTLGREAYAIPGVGVMPPARVVSYFVRHQHSWRICLDGDDAGRSGASSLAQVADAAHLRYDFKELPEGLDVTDLLVARHAEQGCSCATCTAFLAAATTTQVS